ASRLSQHQYITHLVDQALERPPADLRGEPARNFESVAHDTHRYGDVLPDLRAVQVYVHDARAGGEPGGVSGDAVVEPQPDADDQVGVLDGAGHPHLAVPPRHAEEERVAFGEPADAEQRGDHRDAGLFGEGPYFRVGAAENHAVPAHQQGA